MSELALSPLPAAETHPAKRPQAVILRGRFVQVVPLDPAAHAGSLYEGSHGDGKNDLWRYLWDGPYADRESFRAALDEKAKSADPYFFAVIDNLSGDAVGMAAYMRIEPAHRVIEVGSILYTPRLQRTPGSTEAMYLMARHAFDDLGYRRYEWKCNALNAPSRKAALRLGFSFEGIFRQHMIIKGANRDTAWYSMLDREWPACKSAFERWLSPDNFGPDGLQKNSLKDLR